MDEQERWRMERMLLDGCGLKDSDWAGHPAQWWEQSPILLKGYGQALLRQGRIRESRAALTAAVKQLAEGHMHVQLLEAMALLARVQLKAGEMEEARTIAQFLHAEYEREPGEMPGLVAHLLARTAYMQGHGGDGERISALLGAAFERYADSPDFAAYADLLLDIGMQAIPGARAADWPEQSWRLAQRALLEPHYGAYTRAWSIIAAVDQGRWAEAWTLLESMPLHGFDAWHRHWLICAGRMAAVLAGIQPYVEQQLPALAEDPDLERKYWSIRTRLESARGAGGGTDCDLAAQLSAIGLWIGWPQTAAAVSAAPAAAGAADGQAAPASNGARREAGTWQVRCFGKLEFARGGAAASMPEWKRKKARELLVYLLLQPHYSAPRDAVAERLFGEDRDPRKMANQLYVTLHEVKQFFRDRLGQEDAVSLREGTVRIDERIVDYVDVERFAALSRVGEQMWQQDRELALEMFEEACQLAEEELVPEIAYADWLNEWREFVRERRCVMLGRLAEAAAAAGQDRLAEAYAAEWVRVRPLAEEARQMLIRVLAQSGRQAEARRRYEEWERVCQSELGVPPLAETSKLASGDWRT